MTQRGFAARAGEAADHGGHPNQKGHSIMPANGAIVEVSGAGPAPEIELIFGDAQWGKYSVYLWDAAGHNPTLVRKSLNNDQIPDRFPISVSAAELDRCQLTLEVTIGALGGKGQLYSLVVALTQDGKPLTARPFEYRGKLDGAKVIMDYLKLEVI